MGGRQGWKQRLDRCCPKPSVIRSHRKLDAAKKGSSLRTFSLTGKIVKQINTTYVKYSKEGGGSVILGVILDTLLS